MAPGADSAAAATCSRTLKDSQLHAINSHHDPRSPDAIGFRGRTRERARRASFAHSVKAVPVSRIGWAAPMEVSGVASNVARSSVASSTRESSQRVRHESANAVLWRKRHKKATTRPQVGEMNEIRTVATLRSKRAEILASISLYERKQGLTLARHRVHYHLRGKQRCRVASNLVLEDSSKASMRAVTSGCAPRRLAISRLDGRELSPHDQPRPDFLAPEHDWPGTGQEPTRIASRYARSPRRRSIEPSGSGEALWRR